VSPCAPSRRAWWSAGKSLTFLADVTRENSIVVRDRHRRDADAVRVSIVSPTNSYLYVNS
jgi:hypothetical protein